MDTSPFASKTYSPSDLTAPEVTRVARGLERFALRLWLSGVPFAVNGVLRRRFRLRRHKLWEYARGAACLLAVCGKPQVALRAPKDQPAPRVLDFGGGATLPVFYLARCGWEVISLDIDAALTEVTNRVGIQRQGHGWMVRGSTHDLTRSPAPPDWGQFDGVISFSVLEHLAKEDQPRVVERLAGLVKPGGVCALTFDFGHDAPMANAVRDLGEVERLVAATGLAYLHGKAFADTGERFALDKRYHGRRFTFGSVFLLKPEGSTTRLPP